MAMNALLVAWGVTVSSVEMRDVVIPVGLQDAMSREAQAAREKQARIILGQAEMEIAQSFQEAAKSYHDNPTALHLRAMNMSDSGSARYHRSASTSLISSASKKPRPL